METLLLIAFSLALLGFLISLIVFFKFTFSRKFQIYLLKLATNRR